MSKSVKKIVDESKEQGYTEIDLCDKSLSTIADIPGLSKCGKDSRKQKDAMFCLGTFRGLLPFLSNSSRDASRLKIGDCFISRSVLVLLTFPFLAQLRHLVRLTLSHNRLTSELLYIYRNLSKSFHRLLRGV